MLRSLRAACTVGARASRKLLLHQASHQEGIWFTRRANTPLVRYFSTVPPANSQGPEIKPERKPNEAASQTQENAKQENKSQDQTQQGQQQQAQQEQAQQQQQQQQQQQAKQAGGMKLMAMNIFASAGVLLILGGGVLWILRYLESPLYDLVDEQIFKHLRNFQKNIAHNVYQFLGMDDKDVPLLPPALPEGYGRRYTIIIDMDALANSQHANGGWRLHKRAGLDFFLTTTVKNYEIALYSNEYQGSNQQAIFKLDPTAQIFSHQKFRDSTMKLGNQEFTKELHLLQRNPSKVIFIDSMPSARTYDHPNVICVGKSDPDKPDTILIDLAKILNTVANRNVTDLRPLIKELQTKELPNKLRDLANPRSKSQALQQTPAAPQAPVTNGVSSTPALEQEKPASKGWLSFLRG